MDWGECSIVKRHTLVTKVLRSMPMPSREVMRMAATSPAAEQVTFVHATLTSSLSFFLCHQLVCVCKASEAGTRHNHGLDHIISVGHMRNRATEHKCAKVNFWHLFGK